MTRDVPRDPALPGLRALLPDQGAPAFVAEALGESDPSAARVAYVRWWPLKDCTVLWAFADRLVSGVLFAGERGERLVARDEYRRAAGAGAFRYLLDRRLLLEEFPFDRRLAGLPFAASARRVGETLGVELTKAIPVSYKPWRRCVLYYRGERDYFGKVFRHDRAAAMIEPLAAVARQGPWLIPEPAAYRPGERLLLFEAVADSHEMSSLVRAGADVRGYMADAARGLSRFRRLSTSGVPALTTDNVLRQLEHDVSTLAPVVPDLAAVAAARARALSQDLTGLPPERLGLAHGAFRHNQLLVRDGQIAVLDLDGLCRAGTALDPGTFLAGLDRAIVHRPAQRRFLTSCAEAFSGELDVHPSWVSWYRAAARTHLAVREAFGLRPRWRSRAEALLDFVPASSRA